MCVVFEVSLVNGWLFIREMALDNYHHWHWVLLAWVNSKITCLPMVFPFLSMPLGIWCLLTCLLAGGLLICLPREQAAAYCKDIEKQEGYQAWIIGIVEKGCRLARIIDKPRVIEVPSKDRDGELW